MAEQLLERPQVYPPCQQVRCEAVSKCVRSKSIGKAEPTPRRRDRAPHEVGVERAASGTEKEGTVLKGVGTLAYVILDRLAHRRYDRHDAGLRSLPGYSKGLADRENSNGERHCLGYAQTGAVEQQQDRKIARADPRFTRRLGRAFGKAHRLVGRRRSRKRARPLGSARSGKLDMPPLLLGGIGQKCANAGQFASRRGRAEALPSPICEEGAKISRTETEQPIRCDFLASITTEKVDQAVGGRDIGAHRVR